MPSSSSGRHRATLLCSMTALLLVWSAPSPGRGAAPPSHTQKPKAPGAPAIPSIAPDAKPNDLLALIEKLTEQDTPDDISDEALRAYMTAKFKAIATAGARILAAGPNEDQALAATRARFSALIRLQGLEKESAAAVKKELAALPAELIAAGHPELARSVAGVLLHRRLREARRAGPAQLAGVVDAIAKHLADGPVGEPEVALAIQATMMLEQTGDTKAAAKAYAAFGKVLQAAKDPAIVRFGQRMEGSARRLSLPGNSIEIEGTLLDGKKFDWKRYDKKTVLVMFWATWCGPCMDELPRVKDLYQQYHAKGFDVVGISCDDDRKRLTEVVKTAGIPWAILFSGDPRASGMDNPMATKYGIDGIPTMILVGPDGKVISLDARGPVLGHELEKIYGPIKKEIEKEGH